MNTSRFWQRARLGLEVAHQVADARGGECLSAVYKNSGSPLFWVCQVGHLWKARLNDVKNKGTWCPDCAGKARLSLDVAREIAHQRGGECLSQQYVNSLARLQWRCAEGHEWAANLSNVKNVGTWCPQCSWKSSLSIHDARRIARERGGECLSQRYVNAHSHLHWRCAKGHEWKVALQGLKYSGSWCPHCAGKARLSLHVAREIAHQQGGECLSQDYLNVHERLQWRCAKGHTWKASLKSVRNAGTWCPNCASRKGERGVRNIFETIFAGSGFPTQRPLELYQYTKRRLELDGYCPALRLAFEFHGEQHYSHINFFHRSRCSFEAQLDRDRLKAEACSRLGIRLRIVPTMVKDRWTFIRSSLLQWFQLSTIYPLQLTA